MKKCGKWLALLLSVIMLIGLVPMTAAAADTVGLGNFAKSNTYTEGIFTDVSPADWYYENVKAAYEMGLMVGQGEEFGVNNNLTIAEAVTLAARLYSIYVGDGAKFQQGDPWYKVYADYVTSKGIADLKGLDMNAPATRGQFASILCGALPEEALASINAVADDSIPDVKNGDPNADAIYTLYRAGVFAGNDGEGTFLPDANIRRSEVAAVVTRMADMDLRQPVALGDGLKVIFDMNYAGAQPSQIVIVVEPGKRVSAPYDPARAGYGFLGWYTSSSGRVMYDFTKPVTEDITLYAHWRSGVSGGSGRNSGGFTPTFPGQPSNPGSGTFYTVSFDSNGGSSVPSQQVLKGKTLPPTAVPYLAGFSFAGWYLDSNLTDKFDFSEPITGNLMLYAKWVVADDYVLEDSETVGKDDFYILSASEDEVLLEDDTMVYFYVDSTLTISAGFELYCGGEYTGVTLYDDGDYKLHKDDIPNDGRYSGVYEISSDTIKHECNLVFTAQAVVGETEIETNECEVFVYFGLTDAQYAVIDAFETHVANLVFNTTEANSGLEYDAMVEAVRAESETYLQQGVDSGVISSYEYSEEGHSFTWTYAETELQATQFIAQVFPEGEQMKADASGSGSWEEDLEDDIEVVLDYSKGRAIILHYFRQNQPDGWSTDPYDDLGEQLEAAGFAVDYVYDMEVADFKSLQDYDSLIMIDAHGQTSDGSKTGTPMICTQEIQTAEKNQKTYYADLVNGRIERVTTWDKQRVYWISPKFFEDYYQDNRLNDPIVHLGCCRNYPEPENNTQMVSAWAKAGAAATLGYSASVSVSYDAKMIGTIVDELLEGKTVDEALANAKKACGDQDHLLDDDKAWNRYAVLNRFGDGKAVLYPKLRNGNFDAYGILSGWRRYGDARSIVKLSAIEPQSSPNMAIISSGFGSLNGSTTSCLYQTFLVPEKATTLSFSYDVVSEEPMEWVGTEFDDIFRVDILDTNGNLLERVAFESVNTSEWYAIDGIDFPGGDETVYHTRWNSVSKDILAKYSGTLIVLRFAVRDAGDSIYDTAVVIDSVKVS